MHITKQSTQDERNAMEAAAREWVRSRGINATVNQLAEGISIQLPWSVQELQSSIPRNITESPGLLEDDCNECCICYNDIDNDIDNNDAERESKFLCLHKNYCVSCINEYIEHNNRAKCPMCRALQRNPYDRYKPSGSLNFSRINNSELIFNFNGDATVSDSSTTIYTQNVNVMRIMSGMGGRMYAN